MDTAAGTPQFASTVQALGMLESAMGFLADADHAQLSGDELAEILIAMEKITAVQVVARSLTLAVFEAGQHHKADAAYSSPAWLRHRTRITKETAAAYRGWARRVCEHPVIRAAMRDGILTESWARRICAWTGRVPAGQPRRDADTIIVGAAADGLELAQLIRLAAEIAARFPDEGDGPDPFRDRTLRLEQTIDGAGVLRGALTPECTAMLRAVLDSLSKRCGADDTRSKDEREHDALQEACRRLLGTDLLPSKGGRPVQALVHMSLWDLRVMDDGSALEQEWALRLIRLAQQQAGMQAAATETGTDGGAWLSGPAARAMACDAVLFPIVTGHPDLGALQDLIDLCAEYKHLQDDSQDTPPAGSSGDDSLVDSSTASDNADSPAAAAPAAPGKRTASAADGGERMEDLLRRIIGKAADLMSGEGGLASYLRRNQLGQAGLGGRSLPLDVGDTDDIPWWIRRAVNDRDQHCDFPAGCSQPIAATEPHHLEPRAQHGPTSVKGMKAYCFFHHHVVIHRWGWTITVHPDGTSEARSPDGRVYRNGQLIHDTSRPPPARPG
jgi:Domain of unknown function (DUF222)